MTLYDEFSRAKPLFENNEAALEFYTNQYEAMGAKHGMTGDQYWQIAEHSDHFEEDQWAILGIARRIEMAKYLIKKYKSG